MATFDNLGEIFPDENCVLTNRELLVEVRTVCFLHNRLDGIMKQKWLIQIIEYHKVCRYCIFFLKTLICIPNKHDLKLSSYNFFFCSFS